jgi:hypothetical protein
MHNSTTTDEAAPRGRWRWVALAIAAVFLLGHVPFLAPTLEDLDSVNFALGVRHFDPTEHRPHPPGYPIYIALAKLSTAAFDWMSPSGARTAAAAVPAPAAADTRRDLTDNGARGLAIWSAIFGALAVFPLFALFRHLDGDSGRAAPAAVVLAVASPLFWFTAVRPLSDVPGLVAAVAGQALLAAAFMRLSAAPHASSAAPSAGPADDPALARSDRPLLAGLFISALAVGLRSQAVWLTMPLAVFVLAYRVARGRAGRTLVLSAVAAVVGAIIWAVPLVVFTGGVARYLGALAKQGGEDFSGVDMLWRNRTPRRLVTGLLDTFVVPWGSVPLAVVVILLAVIGLFVLLRRRPTAIYLLAAAFLPYAVFHLVFHETVTTRYALPLMLPMAYLAVCGADLVAGRYRSYVAVALIAASFVVVVPPVVRYAGEGSPVSRLFADMRRHHLSEGGDFVLGMHRRVFSETRRAFLWELNGSTYWSRTLPSPVHHEWLELVKYWQGGGNRPMWFLAEPLRTDLALVDPASRRLMMSYRWPFTPGPFVGGVRPGDIDWYELRPPGWFAVEGWGLTPETAGVARADSRGPDRGPIEAWVRRRPGAATMLVGGRNLGGPTDPPVRIDIALDGRPLDTFEVKPAPGFFLRVFDLPAGSLSGEGQYARVTVQAAAIAGGAVTPSAIEQFDVQDSGRIVFGYGDGWHELEHNPVTGRLWRWSSASAAIRIHGAADDLLLRVTGELSPKDFSRPSHVSVRAGAAALGTFDVSSAFTFDVAVPRGALEGAGGVVTLQTDQTFVPDERTHNGDKRRLGLRVYGLTIRLQRAPAAR